MFIELILILILVYLDFEYLVDDRNRDCALGYPTVIRNFVTIAGMKKN